MATLMTDDELVAKLEASVKADNEALGTQAVIGILASVLSKLERIAKSLETIAAR